MNSKLNQTIDNEEYFTDEKRAALVIFFSACMTGIFSEPVFKSIVMANNNQIEIISTAFSQNGHIPPHYTCEGKNVNPPLIIRNIPEGAKTLALIVEDPDAPRGTFDHWLCWNISPNEAISEGSNPGISGTNGFGNTGYGGPCPPSGTHRYFFRVFALDAKLDIRAGSKKQELLDAMKGHVLASGELMGLYEKHKHAVTG